MLASCRIDSQNEAFSNLTHKIIHFPIRMLCYPLALEVTLGHKCKKKVCWPGMLPLASYCKSEKTHCYSFPYTFCLGFCFVLERQEKPSKLLRCWIYRSILTSVLMCISLNWHVHEHAGGQTCLVMLVTLWLDYCCSGKDFAKVQVLQKSVQKVMKVISKQKVGI